MSKSFNSETIKSKEVISYIGLFLGMALLLLMAVSELLVITVYEGTYVVVWAVVVFALYTALFVISITAFSRKIRAAFSPLEESLQKKNQENESLSKELEQKRSEIDEASKLREDLEDYYVGAEADYRQNMARLMRYVDSADDVLKTERILCQDIGSESETIKTLRGQYIADAEGIRSEIKSLDGKNKDISMDMDEAIKAYSVMSENIDNSVKLIENIFTELNSVTTLCSQLELYSMNTSIEIARSGMRSMSVINAIDEIKKTSKKISDKNDAIALLIIQAKNSVSLALDQSSVCEELLKQNNEDYERGTNSLNGISEKIRNMSVSLDKLMESISLIAGYAYKTESYIDKNDKYLGYIRSGLLEYMDSEESN